MKPRLPPNSSAAKSGTSIPQAERLELLQLCLRYGLTWGIGCAHVAVMEDYKAIDYARRQGGLTCNGILSDMGGAFDALWTFDREGQLVTDERPLTDEAFALLWDGIAASVSAGGVFWRCLVTDPTRLMDPDLYHVISTVQAQGGWAKHRTFMVPAGEAEPAFLAWFESLAVPSWEGRAWLPGRMPEAQLERSPVCAGGPGRFPRPSPVPGRRESQASPCPAAAAALSLTPTRA